MANDRKYMIYAIHSGHQNFKVLHLNGNYKATITYHQKLFSKTNLEGVIASTYQPSQDQTHKGCTGTWSTGP